MFVFWYNGVRYFCTYRSSKHARAASYITFSCSLEDLNGLYSSLFTLCVELLKFEMALPSEKKLDVYEFIWPLII